MIECEQKKSTSDTQNFGEIISPKIYQDHSDLPESLEESSEKLVESNLSPELFQVTTPSKSGRDKHSQNIEPHVLFASKLSSYPDMARARAEKIINDTDQLFKTFFDKIKDIQEVIVDSDNSNNISQRVTEILERNRSCFSDIATEWRCFKKFGKQGTFIPPQHYCLGQREEFVHKEQTQILKMVPVSAQYIPIRRVLKKFFEIPNYFEETLNYIETVNNKRNIITNIIQCQLWKNITQKFEDKLVLPLYLYYDDYENNNPLGSHNGLSKCGAVYLSIACLLPHLASKLENIFLFILFNTLDRQIFYNTVVFSKAIEELNHLEMNGIEIDLPEGKKKIYFQLALILGDNLGLHYLFGLVENFNANFFCRFCYTMRTKI